MENIDDILFRDGTPPHFSRAEMEILRKRAEAAEVINIPKQVMGYTKGAYDIRAYNFALSYKRNELPWSEMNKKQRVWLWRIKDSLEKTRR